MSVYHTLKQLLIDQHISFRKIEHAPTRTSEDSARERGEPLEIGGKAVVLKVG